MRNGITWSMLLTFESPDRSALNQESFEEKLGKLMPVMRKGKESYEEK